MNNNEKLENLAQLKEEGIIDGEEFEKKKEKILDLDSETKKNSKQKIKLLTKCAWGFPANNGVLIALENKIVLKKFKMISGWINLLTAGLVSVFLYSKYVKQIKKKRLYDDEFKSNDDNVINLNEVKKIKINEKKLSRSSIHFIFKVKEDKKIYLPDNEDINDFKKIYSKKIDLIML